MANVVEPGAVIDGFNVGDQVYSGGMSRIFRVTRPGLSDPLCMKAPRLGRNAPGENIVGFETEATIVPTLTGPHVPAFVAVGDLGRVPYLVTQWIEGESLEDKLGVGRLAPGAVAELGAAIADALHSLHQQGVVHLDVKPSNLLVRPNGNVVLIDFGFAHHSGYPDLLAEETRFRAGSAPYVSPEQLLGTRDDRRSDLFALGVVLYEAATGTLPFGEPDTDVRNRFWLDPNPPTSLVPELPPWLQEIILRCLEPHAELRYQSAAHLAFDLRNPAQVALTARATKLEHAGPIAHLGRFLRARDEYGARLEAPAPLQNQTPIVLVPIDTAHLDDERHTAIRRITSQFLAQGIEFRLLCLTVIQTPESSLEHLLRLRHWAGPLRLAAERLSLHAIESDKPADVIVELASHNNADLVILGAPSEGGRAWSQSVASDVSARVKCSVHLVRAPKG